jgi:hypothetical protein
MAITLWAGETCEDDEEEKPASAIHQLGRGEAYPGVSKRIGESAYRRNRSTTDDESVANNLGTPDH